MVQRIQRKDFMKGLRSLKAENIAAKTGFFESSRYPDGTPVAYVAAIQEFGYPEGNIPQRSFMRSTVSEERDKYREHMKKYARQIISGKMTPADALERIALTSEGDIRKKITKIQDPPLKESTLRSRRSRGNNSTKPLNDIGYMLSQLTSVVERV